MCAIELMNRLISLKVIFVKKKRPHTNRRSQDVHCLFFYSYARILAYDNAGSKRSLCLY